MSLNEVAIGVSLRMVVWLSGTVCSFVGSLRYGMVPSFVFVSVVDEVGF